MNSVSVKVRGNDLGGGEAPANASSLLTYYRLAEKQQNTLLIAAVIFCAVMTWGFLWFVCRVVNYYLQVAPEGQEIQPFDWHILLVGSSLIIPPTIVMLALLARIYQRQSSSSGKSSSAEDAVPSLSQALVTMNELVATLTELVKPSKK